ncbi:MAG: nucleotide exchange factor GrpE [Acidobacteria bacterium]|nr:nucleotide exchange factor GrpE [Acidobacteriota bacterium]
MDAFDDTDISRRSTTAEAVHDASSADAPAGEPPTPAADALAGLQREKDALQDRLLRLAAEFDNYRKRVDRERRDQADAAVAGAVEDLLPIVDDLERALEAPAGSVPNAYRQGVELIHRRMVDLLRKRGVTAFDAVGADFDPHVHQAVVHEASATHREGEVIEQLSRGYMLGDRLLRPAMVKVAKA